MAWLDDVLPYNPVNTAKFRQIDRNLAQYEAFLMEGSELANAGVRLLDIRSLSDLKQYLKNNDGVNKYTFTRAQLDDMRAELGDNRYSFELSVLVSRKALARFSRANFEQRADDAETAFYLASAGGAKNAIIKMTAKINKWVGAAGAVVLVKEILDNANEYIDELLIDYIKRKYELGEFDQNIEDLSAKFGVMSAKIFNAKLKQKTGLESPITNFFDDDIDEQLGGWGATLVNEQLSRVTKQDLAIFTNIINKQQVQQDLTDFLPQAGEMGAQYLNELLTKLIKKPVAPFTTLYPLETVQEDLMIYAPQAGEQIAQIINAEVSKIVGKPVHILNTIYPLDNVLTDIDTFITNEINDRLQINISGVIKNKNIKRELQEQLTSLIAQIVTERVAQSKLTLIDDLNLQNLSAADLLTAKQQLTKIINDVLLILDSYKINGVKGAFFGYYSKNKAKINNRASQRKYRTKYKEVRQWVIR